MSLYIHIHLSTVPNFHCAYICLYVLLNKIIIPNFHTKLYNSEFGVDR